MVQSLILQQFALLNETTNGVQEISVVYRIVLLTVYIEQIVPDISAKRALVRIKHARCLRN